MELLLNNYKVISDIVISPGNFLYFIMYEEGLHKNTYLLKEN